MKFLIYLTIILTKVQYAFAYIPTLDFILNKSTSTTGRQIISIDQDVIFKIGSEEAVIQENWLIEGDKNLKLTAKGAGFFKAGIDLHFLYNGKVKTSIVGKNKIATTLSSDFFQKYLFIRSTEAFKGHLKELGILNQTRLSRADGRVCYAIGEPSGEKRNPQIWIDQDEFIIRKLRLPSEVDIELSDATQVTKDLVVAKSQLINWAGTQVIIKIKNISVKPSANLSNFYPQNLDHPSELTFANKSQLTEAIDQFYKRFR